MCSLSEPLRCRTLVMDFAKGKGKGKSPEDLRRAQAFHTFSSNDALNFSCWLQVWQVNFFTVVLWSGYQKEHLEYAMLFQLSREDGSLPPGLLSVYFPGMFRARAPPVLCLRGPTCTADPLATMGVERFVSDLVLNLADFSSTRRWTWFLSLFTSVFLRRLGISSFRGFKLLDCCRYLLVMFPGLVTVRATHLSTFRFRQGLQATSF